MIKHAIERVVARIKGEPYALDESLTSIDCISILVTKAFDLLRGILRSPGFKRSRFPLFVGKQVTIKHARKINLGRGVTIGNSVAINALSKHGIEIGDNVSIGDGSIIECTGVIRALGDGLIIGNRVGISKNAYISVRGRVKIGDDCIFGPNVSIQSENHSFDKGVDVPIRLQGEVREGVTIENDCWVGCNAVILDGVTVGAHSVIGAGAVVTSDIPPKSVAVGVPARVIKARQ